MILKCMFLLFLFSILLHGIEGTVSSTKIKKSAARKAAEAASREEAEEEEIGVVSAVSNGVGIGVVSAVSAAREAAEEEIGVVDPENELDSLKATIAALTEKMKSLEKQVQASKASAGSGTAHPFVNKLSADLQKRILITGGAGFVGSNLVDVLMTQGHLVTVIDNLFTGRKKNIAHWIGHPNFDFQTHDVVNPFMMECDQIYHLACPASPPHYQFNPIKTIKTTTHGTLNMLGLAKRVGARILYTSTSEIYGDPEVHPQQEDYWGHVNPIGPRSCYDEGKRIGETMCYSYMSQEGVEVRVARIFNTFGPRMHPNDGRVVSNFIIQALQGKDLTVYGTGEQTRSFQYVSDLVNGLITLMNSDTSLPVNLGNPVETTILDFAKYIQGVISPDTPIKHKPANTDDPKQRKPDITRADELLNWHPQVDYKDGLVKTIEYFKYELGLLSETQTMWIAGPESDHTYNVEY